MLKRLEAIDTMLARQILFLFVFPFFEGKTHILLRNDIRAGKFNVEVQQRKYIIGQLGLNRKKSEQSNDNHAGKYTLNLCLVHRKIVFFSDVERESFRCL